jgi:MFS family permease
MAINAIYSAATFEFQDMRDLIFGVLEASYGIGFKLGPLIGQLLYAKYGLRDCFLILSCILTLPMPLIYFMTFAKEEQLNMSREIKDYRGRDHIWTDDIWKQTHTHSSNDDFRMHCLHDFL